MNKVGKRLRMIPNINLGILMHIHSYVPTHMQNVHAHHIHIKRRKGGGNFSRIYVCRLS